MATITLTTASSDSSHANTGQMYRGPFAIMTVLFFMLVQSAFFGACGIGSLILTFFTSKDDHRADLVTI